MKLPNLMFNRKQVFNSEAPSLFTNKKNLIYIFFYQFFLNMILSTAI